MRPYKKVWDNFMLTDKLKKEVAEILKRQDKTIGEALRSIEKHSQENVGIMRNYMIKRNLPYKKGKAFCFAGKSMKNEPVPVVETAKEKLEVSAAPVKMEAEEISAEYAAKPIEVPEMQSFSTSISPAQEPAKTEADKTDGEQLDFEGFDALLIDIIDSRFKGAGIDGLSDDEKRRMSQHYKRFIDKRMKWFNEYADVINIVFAFGLPIGSRIFRNWDLLKRRREENRTRNQQEQARQQEQEQPAATESEHERAMREFRNKQSENK